MLITYIRSSSVGTYDLCPFKYFLCYVLGLKEQSGYAADRGTIYHGVMQLLAEAQLSKQKGLSSFDGEHFGHIETVDGLDPHKMFEVSYNWYTSQSPHHKWCEKDKKQIRGWIDKTIELWPHYDPRNLNIIKPEFMFDHTIMEPWAEYNYKINGEDTSGYLNLRGTIDLLSHTDDTTLEITDYKTGARQWNWALNKEKKYLDFQYDVQFRLYHYIACKYFPQYDNVIVNVLYVAERGPSTIHLDRSCLPETEDILREYFEIIRKTVKPKLTSNRKSCFFCHFYKNNHYKDGKDTGQRICNYLKAESDKKTEEQMISLYGSEDAHVYSGGGRSGIKIKEE